MSSDSTSETDYVHAQFYDTDRLEAIRDVKHDHEATWKELIEYGARYLEIIDEVTHVQTDAAIQRLLADAKETQPELIDNTGVNDTNAQKTLFEKLYRAPDEATQSHGETPSSPKRDPDITDPE